MATAKSHDARVSELLARGHELGSQRKELSAQIAKINAELVKVVGTEGTLKPELVDLLNSVLIPPGPVPCW